MGRSRGGLTTKIHALVDANGLPVVLKLTEGQAHDGKSAADMRKMLEARGAWANVRPMPGRVSKPAFSPFLYRYRNLVERFFSKLKHNRAIATRYEKLATNYLALVKLAATRIWINAYESIA